MQRRFFWFYQLVLLILVCLPVWLVSLPAHAAVDPYITRYLRVADPISLDLNEQGETRVFSPAELSDGKQLFEQNCLNCHVGGATLPDPSVSLSLADLQGATPPRNTIVSLVTYFRQPMTYDGSEETFWCRQIPESWLPQAEVEKLAGFILRAAQTAPGWGTETFEDN